MSRSSDYALLWQEHSRAIKRDDAEAERLFREQYLNDRLTKQQGAAHQTKHNDESSERGPDDGPTRTA